MKTGTIAKVKFKESFVLKNGPAKGQTMYCFDMAIKTDKGMLIGEINSKSEEYPMAVDDEINVEVTTNVYGNKFKKVNPQYAGGGTSKADDPEKVHGMCFFGLMQATIQGSGNPLALKEQPDVLCALADFATACMNSYDYRTTGKPVATEPTPEPQQDDDIPF